jgi:hypothetical protein
MAGGFVFCGAQPVLIQPDLRQAVGIAEGRKEKPQRQATAAGAFPRRMIRIAMIRSLALFEPRTIVSRFRVGARDHVFRICSPLKQKPHPNAYVRNVTFAVAF